MTNRWLASDHHLGHSNILTFVGYKGEKVRKFSSVEEMNETIIERHNALVKEHDVVYFLGDVVINKKFLPLVERMNGSKRLILGNHDPYFDLYGKYFKKIYAMRIFPREFILTHIPIHTESVERFKVNLHGHIHQNSMNGIRYRNCCVDFSGDDYYPSNDYKPLNLEDIRDDLKSKGLI